MHRFAILIIFCISMVGCSGTTVPEQKQQTDLPLPEKPATQPHSSHHVQAAPNTIERKAFDEIMDAGPAAFIRQVRVKPFLQHNRFVGFQLVDLFPDDPRFYSANIHRGDVIVSINGLPIERPEQFMKAWEEIRSANSLIFKIVRRGKLETITYTIR